jgi:multidrug efflux system membrane fusion protein
MSQLHRNLALIVLGSLLLTACEKPTVSAEKPRLVKLISVETSSSQQSLDLAGEIKARVESPLGFRVSGKITRRLVETGQIVRKGQALAELDPRDYELAKNASSSQVTAAKADLALAEAEYKRFQELQAKQFVSDLDLDRKRVAVSAASARLKSLESSVSLDSNRIADTILRADSDGVVSQVQADVGMVVSAGQPIVTIAQQGEREIVVEFPEDRRSIAEQYSQAQVSLWAQPQAKYPAQLRELSAVADPVTRTFRARYRIQAPNNALALGQSATLHLSVQGQSGLIKLPTSALVGKGQQTSVWLFNPQNQKLNSQAVQVAGVDGNEVIVAGLQQGQQVVVAGVHVVHEGQVVRPLLAKHAGAGHE